MGYFLLFYAKDKNGVNLSSTSLYLHVDQIVDQISQTSLDYSIGAGRNKNTGVSKLLIGNNSQSDKLNVTVYAKEMQNFGEQKYYDSALEIIDDIWRQSVVDIKGTHYLISSNTFLSTSGQLSFSLLLSNSKHSRAR